MQISKFAVPSEDAFYITLEHETIHLTRRVSLLSVQKDFSVLDSWDRGTAILFWGSSSVWPSQGLIRWAGGLTYGA